MVLVVSLKYTGHYLLHKLLLTSSLFTSSDTSTISSSIVSSSEDKSVIVEDTSASNTISSFYKILPKDISIESPSCTI